MVAMTTIRSPTSEVSLAFLPSPTVGPITVPTLASSLASRFLGYFFSLDVGHVLALVLFHHTQKALRRSVMDAAPPLRKMRSGP